MATGMRSAWGHGDSFSCDWKKRAMPPLVASMDEFILRGGGLMHNDIR